MPAFATVLTTIDKISFLHDRQYKIQKLNCTIQLNILELVPNGTKYLVPNFSSNKQF